MRHRPTTRVVRRRPGFAGLTGAVLFFCLSFTPSLLPRSWIMQAVVGGVSAALGYGVAGFVGTVMRRLVRVRPGEPVRRIAWASLLIGGTALSLAALWRSTLWQRELRRLMGLDETLDWTAPLILVGAAAVFAAVVLVSRVVRLAVRTVAGVLTWFVPLAIASVLSVGLVALLMATLVSDFLFRGVVGIVDVSAERADTRTERGLTPPTSPQLSGGPGSLVPWRTLGRYGRAFVGSAVPRGELRRFSGRPAVPPIRVYVGLRSSDSFAGQADLAVRELVRTGAFGRRVLAVMATTGTGWVNGEATDALELMYGGDSALVAIQYSSLPSWLSFLVDRSKAVRATRALVTSVHARWARLPPERRPTLVVFGESLGSYGVESAYGELRRLTAHTDGALLVGPTGFNPIWNRLTDDRDAGSPPWRPIHRQGRTVRFAQEPGDLARPSTPWPYPRVVYVQNASDPVIWWSPRLIYRRPDWLDAPRGPGVSGRMEWYPIVTFCQVTVDLMVARGVPPEHGHRYGGNVVDGWAAIAPPPGWTAADTARLHAHLIAR